MPHRTILLACGSLLAVVPVASAQTAADTMAIVSTALDYIEGFYEGDAPRVKQVLHPALAKRAVFSDGDGADSELRHLSAAQVVEITRQGGGSTIPADERQSDIAVLDIFGNAASVKIDAGRWIDYLHLARFDGRWVIINVLWELEPRDPGSEH